MSIFISLGTGNAKKNLQKIDSLNLNSFLRKDLGKIADTVDSSGTVDAILSKMGTPSVNVRDFVVTLSGDKTYYTPAANFRRYQ